MKATCFTMATLIAYMHRNVVVHTLPACLSLNVYCILIYYCSTWVR